MIEPSVYDSWIKVSEAEFKRILSNIINNSIESFEPRGQGSVTLALKPAAESAFIHIVISDTGKGISPEILPQLGQRRLTFGKTHGSGLGLSYAFSRIESWLGQIWIKSTLNQGTQVTLSLPQSKPGADFSDFIGIKDQSRN